MVTKDVVTERLKNILPVDMVTFLFLFLKRNRLWLWYFGTLRPVELFSENVTLVTMATNLCC